MKKDNKKVLYESIMTSVAKEVKKALNEGELNKNEKYKYTDVLTRKLLEPNFIIPKLQELFKIEFRQSTKTEDYVDKIDILSADQRIKIQVKTRQTNKNYTIHTNKEYLNNDFIIFFECPFTEEMIINNDFLNNFDALHNYISQMPHFYIVPSSIIQKNAKLMQNQDGKTYYLIFKDVVEQDSIKCTID